MSILAIVGVIVSSAAMFVVLSGFSGLKDYSLEFISFVSPDLKITSVKGKSFEFTNKIRSFLEDENISYSLSYEDKALISINENIRIIALKDTIDAIYNIDNGILTLTTSEKATDEFYGFTSILKYKNN